MMIHEFNLVLLGKQLWRLVQFLDSLLAKVLREKYFRCSPLRLNNIYNPSYRWASIMAANPLIELGIRKSIQEMRSEFGKTFGYRRYQPVRLDLMLMWFIR